MTSVTIPSDATPGQDTLFIAIGSPGSGSTGEQLYGFGATSGTTAVERLSSGAWTPLVSPWDSILDGGEAYTGLYVPALGKVFLGGWTEASPYPVVMYSSDGSTWVSATTPLDGTHSSGVFGFAWNGSLLVAVGEGPTTTSHSVMTSPDGVTWTGRSSVFDGNGTGNDVAWNGSYFLAVGWDASGDATAATSPDGVTWTTVTTFPWTTSSVWGNSVCWYAPASLWVVVGQAPTPGQILTSPDASVWTTRSTGLSGTPDWQVRSWNGKLYVAGSDVSGTMHALAVSTDGVSWSTVNSDAGQLISVYWDGSVFWGAVGGTGGIVTSLDGVTWTTHSSPFTSGTVMGFFDLPFTGSSGLPTTPAGWTPVGQVQTPSGSVYLTVCRKLCAPGDPGSNVDLGGVYSGVCATYTLDTDVPVETVVPTFATSTSSVATGDVFVSNAAFLAAFVATSASGTYTVSGVP